MVEQDEEDTAEVETEAEPSGAEPSEAEPSVDFATFALSIAANAVMHMRGEADDGRVAGSRIDLSAAAEHIDILSMLERKTLGNLTKQESDLIQSVLYDLRMQYLECSSRR